MTYCRRAAVALLTEIMDRTSHAYRNKSTGPALLRMQWIGPAIFNEKTDRTVVFTGKIDRTATVTEKMDRTGHIYRDLGQDRP